MSRNITEHRRGFAAGQTDYLEGYEYRPSEYATTTPDFAEGYAEGWMELAHRTIREVMAPNYRTRDHVREESKG